MDNDYVLITIFSDGPSYEQIVSAQMDFPCGNVPDTVVTPAQLTQSSLIGLSLLMPLKLQGEPWLRSSVGWSNILICQGYGFHPWSRHMQESIN